jgi:hypothetical protein
MPEGAAVTIKALAALEMACARSLA